MEGIGAAAGPVGVGPSREPLWPEGIVGSITHTDGFIAAAVAPALGLLGLGVDAESATTLGVDVRRHVLTREEMDADLGDALELVAFSAKESIHKAVFPFTRVWMDFLDVSLTFDTDQQTFRVERTVGAARKVPGLVGLTGRYSVGDDLTLTVCSYV